LFLSFICMWVHHIYTLKYICQLTSEVGGTLICRAKRVCICI
jgi:hypothetical protein